VGKKVKKEGETSTVLLRSGGDESASRIGPGRKKKNAVTSRYFYFGKGEKGNKEKSSFPYCDRGGKGWHNEGTKRKKRG